MSLTLTERLRLHSEATLIESRTAASQTWTADYRPHFDHFIAAIWDTANGRLIWHSEAAFHQPTDARNYAIYILADYRNNRLDLIRTTK